MAEEDHRMLMVGGLIGGDSTVNIVGGDLPYSEEEVQAQLNIIDFMQAVGCFNCPVMTELKMKPSLDVQSVLGSRTRTLVTAYCPGGVKLIDLARQAELGCHTPQKIELHFKRE